MAENLTAKLNREVAPEQLSNEQSNPRLPKYAAKLAMCIGITWALFQLWIASPLPFMLDIPALVFNDTQARSIHLMFAVFLGFVIYPMRLYDSPPPIPFYDWILAAVGAFCAAYLFLFYENITLHLGNPTTLDLVVGLVGLATLLEVCRRSVGLPLSLIAIICLIYTVIGPHLGDLLAHKGASIGRLVTHQWLTTEGVFGVPLGVSSAFIFLFVLFGAMLEKAGAGRYFITTAFALLGHLRGGPAKASVLASALMGLISGSSIANAVTVGTFTIPLMKRAGYTKEQAAAIEVSGSVNGQITPPVMGAAAFLMVEYINMPYTQIIEHAFLPAIISYIALMYIVHLEAIKANLRAIPRTYVGTWYNRLLRGGLVLAGVGIFLGAAYYVVTGINYLFGDYSIIPLIAVIALAYIGLLLYSTTVPELQELDVENATSLPPVGETVRSGLYFFLPIVVLVWCLMIARLSPALSAFYGTLMLMAMMLTQHVILALFKRLDVKAAFMRSCREFKESLVAGSFNMVTLALATAVAGIIVGTVTLTGVGHLLTQLIETLSMGSLTMVLILTAIFCMILGMGLPTTANYIVISTLMAPVIVTLAASHGEAIPLIAVHLFVLYFGVMADITPPVGLAAFAAAGIAGANPITTGVKAFMYSIRTLLLPFIFLFNTELLLIGIQGPFHFILVVSIAVAAMLIFVAGTQNYFLVRNKIWESALLVIVALSLFRPEFWMNMVYPPYETVAASELTTEVAQMNPGDQLRLYTEVNDPLGKAQFRTFIFTIPDVPADQRLSNMGLTVAPEGENMAVTNVELFSTAESVGMDGFNKNTIMGIQHPLYQPNKGWFYIPFLLLFGVITYMQYRRKQENDSTAPVTTTA